MFHFTDKVDWKWFFRYDKKWIENMNWALISPAAKAILPVIGCHSNERGESFPAEVTIAGFSGRTEKTVRQGIRDLEGFPGFYCVNYVTNRGKKSKKFYLELPPKGEQGRSFFFYRAIIDCGAWSQLSPTAQALYPVMRYFAQYVADEDETLDDMDEFSERYAQRRWELCIADIGELARFAGIDRHSVKDAIKNLTENFLIEPYETDIGEKGWKVYFIPKRYWKAGYLNQKLRAKIGA